MQITNDTRIQQKLAIVIILTGVITNIVAVANNSQEFGISQIIVICAITILLQGGVGSYLCSKKKYMTCIKVMYYYASFIQVPFCCVLAGIDDAVYFLCSAVLIPVVAPKKNRHLHLGAFVAMVLLSFMLHYFVLGLGPQEAGKINHAAHVLIANILVIVTVTLLVSEIADALEEAGKQNYVASLIYDNLRFCLILNLNDAHFECLREEKLPGINIETHNFDVMNAYVVAIDKVHPSDVDIFKSITDRTHIKGFLSKNGRYTSEPIRLNLDGEFEWYEFEFAEFPGYSEKNPYCISYMKQVDSMDSDSEDAMRLVEESFYKIFRVNLTDSTYRIVKCTEEELAIDNARTTDFISDRFAEFLERGCVHDEDKAGYIEFTNIDRMRKAFSENADCQILRYRRLVDGRFRWVNMEVRKSVDYTHGHESVVLYIKDINDDYVNELAKNKLLEIKSNFDALTGVYNRYKYYEACGRINLEKTSAGIIFFDINGLKEVNDNEGHVAGDRLIVGFSNLIKEQFGVEKCYRLSGDEFLVIWEGVKEEKFLEVAETFRNNLENEHGFVASVGYAYGSNLTEVEHLVADAEKTMYEHKRKYYENHPNDRRSR